LQRALAAHQRAVSKGRYKLHDRIRCREVIRSEVAIQDALKIVSYFCSGRLIPINVAIEKDASRLVPEDFRQPCRRSVAGDQFRDKLKIARIR
jgi:hypothetical protein